MENALWMNAEARCLPRHEAERAYWAAHELGSRRGELLEILYLGVADEDWEEAGALLDRHPEIATDLVRTGLDLLRGRDAPEQRAVWEAAAGELPPRSCFWRGVIGESLGERESAGIDFTTALQSDRLEFLAARRLARWHGQCTCRSCLRNAADYCFGDHGVWCQKCLSEITTPGRIRNWIAVGNPRLVRTLGPDLPVSFQDQPVALDVWELSQAQIIQACAAGQDTLDSAQILQSLLPDSPAVTEPSWVLQTAWWRSQLWAGTRWTNLAESAQEALALYLPEGTTEQVKACESLENAAHRLDATQRAAFAELLKRRPDDLFLRVVTLEELPENLIWLAERRPRLSFQSRYSGQVEPALRLRLVRAWKAQLENHPGDAAVLGAAAEFFGRKDLEIAQILYLRCLELDPLESRWPKKLGFLLSNSDPMRALTYVEQAHHLASEPDRLLGPLLRLAVRARDGVRARFWAEKWLAMKGSDLDVGEARNKAHLALGRLALQEKDFGAAGRHLVASAQGPSTPTLGSFGPSMLLAKDLLEAGEHTAVLEYFCACRSIWESGGQMLDTWIAKVSRGEIPDFGPNLRY